MRQVLGLGLARIGRLIKRIPELWLLTAGAASPDFAYVWDDTQTWDDTKFWTD